MKKKKKVNNLDTKKIVRAANLCYLLAGVSLIPTLMCPVKHFFERNMSSKWLVDEMDVRCQHENLIALI